MGRRFDTDELVDELCRLGDDDPLITQQEFCREVGVSVSTIARRFGSWGDLRVRAGLPRDGRKGRRQAISDAEILSELRRIGQDDPLITQREFCQRVGVSEGTVVARLGPWADLRERVGLPRRGRTGAREVVDRETLLAEFRRAVAEVGPLLTCRQFKTRTGHGDSTICRHFGTWTALRASEGLPLNTARRDRISDAEIARHYEDVAQATRQTYRREPTPRELELVTPYSGNTYRRRLQRWKWQRRAQAILKQRQAQREAERLAADHAAATDGEVVTEEPPGGDESVGQAPA